MRIVVGFAPGGLNDINARLIGHWLSERLRQQFIIDNRPGASGNIAMESVVRSLPDGYTLVTVATSSAVNVTLFKNLPFNFLRDIAPVGSIRLFDAYRWQCRDGVALDRRRIMGGRLKPMGEIAEQAN